VSKWTIMGFTFDSSFQAGFDCSSHRLRESCASKRDESDEQQDGALGEVLAQETVGILVRASPL